MMNSQNVVQSLSSLQLLSATRELVQQTRGTEADLLEHLAEIEERKLHLDGAYSSMFGFCVGEYGFSEDVAYQRITVARAARRLPIILGALRSGRVHMTGLRLLAPHMNERNVGTVLAEATGKSTRQIEELIARLAPKPPVPTVIRRLPAHVALQPPPPMSCDVAAAAASPDSPPAMAPVPVTPMPHREERRAVMKPLAEDTYKFQFTASRACHEKLRQAQALLRHRIPNGDVGAIVERALDLLIDTVVKERFAAGRKPRSAEIGEAPATGSRHIPDAIKRAVFERDGGRCTHTDETGRRCGETDVEFDHVHGFARTRVHRVEDIRLLCRSHNQRAAEKMYGRDFMERARSSRSAQPALPGIPSA